MKTHSFRRILVRIARYSAEIVHFQKKLQTRKIYVILYSGSYQKEFRKQSDFKISTVLLYPQLPEKCPYSELFWSYLGIQSEYGKMRARITLNTDTFYPVHNSHDCLPFQ